MEMEKQKKSKPRKSTESAIEPIGNTKEIEKNIEEKIEKVERKKDREDWGKPGESIEINKQELKGKKRK